MELFEQLMDLCSKNNAFFYIDQINPRDGRTYRVFSYRLASYTDFCMPGALECRGIMYEMSDSGEFPVCLPFPKFFNLGENPFTIGLNHSKIVKIMDKRDGSLISTFFNGNNELDFKSKQSLTSSQVEDAFKVINRPEHKDFKDLLSSLAYYDYTVNLEYTSPMNRIVLGYPTSELRILSVRDLTDRSFLSKEQLITLYPQYKEEIDKYWVDELPLPDDLNAFIDSIPAMTDIEGFVVQYESGQLVKIKTDWYKALHHAKDSVNIPRRLFECIIEETVDDLRSMFSEDPIAMQLIEDMEKKVVPVFNGYQAKVQKFLEENRHLDRKDFAIKGQAELSDGIFSMAMMPYLGKEVDWKAWAKKNIKLFGIKEELEPVSVE